MRFEAKVQKKYVLTIEVDERELNQILTDIDYCLAEGHLDTVFGDIYNEIQEQVGDV